MESIDPESFLKVPVEPSEGNYYEAGLTKVFFGKVKFNTNYYRRLASNYADDDQMQNTAISFPIAFRKAVIYGAEGKLEVPGWHRFSGFLSYSYMVGNAWYPVTGGLFLGDDAHGIPTSGHFPGSQDQRNTLRGRVRYQLRRRFWLAGGIQYDTGLPFEFQCDPSLTFRRCIDGPGGPAETYGQAVVSRINFARGRIYPSFQLNASAGADIHESARLSVHLQVDGQTSPTSWTLLISAACSRETLLVLHEVSLFASWQTSKIKRRVDDKSPHHSLTPQKANGRRTLVLSPVFVNWPCLGTDYLPELSAS